MGIALCKPERDAAAKNRQIETQIRIENQANKRKIKMLLLGISDSGKSTIVKQMRVNYCNGFNETEVVNAIFLIRNNIIDAFKHISLLILDSHIIKSDTEKVLLKLFAFESQKIEMMQEVDELRLINSIRVLECISVFFEHYSYHPMIPDNIHYFFPHLERIAISEYMPTVEDLIHMRQTTLGVHEISFDYQTQTIRLIDVGGQKTERRKWIHFFEGVTAVMFVCSLSSFNQATEQEPNNAFAWETSLNKVQNKILVRSTGKAKQRPGMVNRLDESVDLFTSIRENNFLKSSNFMLFLNKIDLLGKKLETIQFVNHFPAYEQWITNDNSVQSVAEFIESMFREGLDADQKIYAHLTQATITTNIEYTFGLCCDVIFNKNIETLSLE
ncbi:Protein CBR-GPA-5 [Caenorhabditis briggsae]|uniref:Guanine nucleotide-binding protein alpha-5 subunit n=2 Tax=Caenorhabditis briggsae TaxID=6238 RepID=GPA5_CAEBR|nr:Protein CBR-GPA-5 [Caenorhabditis briggsae]Q619V5.1 RecName: Full=Guanine nucleotide-binding protein alpha-5 subunit [Caenorhabditis briggsae]AAW02904.1 gpa-5 [Caenorhabditis briggsae]ULT81598.1 hypothetical protein L3Y34_011527 [Caenorhabditis briggsae]CAP32734.1 Protein CBR-GPA-5 [Caenorhabditis briggsae]